MAARRAAAPALALAALLAGACEVKQPPTARDSAAVRAAQARWDSAADAVRAAQVARARGDSAAPAAAPPAVVVPAVVVPAVTVPGAAAAAAADSVRLDSVSRDGVAVRAGEPIEPPDTTAAPRATAEELATLAQGLVMPVAGVTKEQLVDSFDEARGSRRHDALDILAPRGTPVVSAADGRLLRMISSENGGLMVYATDASERFILMYAHLDRYASGLTEGMVLRRGDRLGDVGTTGNAPPNTPHLHFAISRAGNVRDWWKGTPVNPLPLLRPSTP